MIDQGTKKLVKLALFESCLLEERMFVGHSTSP